MEIIDKYFKHVFWGTVAIVLACLALIAFGNENARTAAIGVLFGIGVLVFSFLLACL